MHITDVGLRSLPVPEKGQRSFWDDNLPTFGVRISQGGSKTFILKHQNRFHTIGRFPVLSLADARAEAKRMLAEFTLGRIRPQSMTVKQAIQAFLGEKEKSRRPRTVQDYKWLLNRHFAFPGQLTDVTSAQITHRLAKLPRGQHNHALTAGRIFFNWCRKQRYLTENPCEGFAKHSTHSRTRILSDAELKAIWNSADQTAAHFGTIVKLLVLTGQRRGEIATLQSSWLDVENKTLTIPASVAKNGRESVIPVCAYSAEVLTPLLNKQISASGYIFSARTPTSKPFNGWGKSKAALDAHAGVTNWVLHDIRRTVATRLAEMGAFSI